MSLSLRGRIILATFLPLILFGLLAAAFGLQILRSTSEELALQRQTALTRVAAAGVAANLRAGARVLDNTARDLGELAGNAEKQQELLLDRVAALGAFTAVILLDADGRVVAAVPPGTPTAGFDFAGQQFFREVRAVQSPVFSGVFRYDPTGQPVTVVAVPVRSRDSFSGVLVGGFSLARSEWARDLNLIRTPGGSTAYLVDGAGTVIFRPGSATIGESIRFAPDLWELASSGSPDGAVQRPAGTGGGEVVVTYAPVEGTGWGLFVEEPWQPIIAPVVRAQLAVVGLLGLGVILALFALVYSLRRALGPLGALVEEGRRVAGGQSFRPIPENGPPDLRALLRAVNEMVLRLEDQRQALRRYAAQVLGAQESERLRLSRELHDGAVQDLVGLAQRLELCRDAITEDPAGADERLREVEALARKSVAELRRLSNDMRPSVLDDLGLAPALRLVVRELARDLPATRTNFEVVGESVRLPPEVDLGVFRIAQEAVSNVRKHARSATRVSVALIYEGERLTLQVEDDGPGFDGSDRERLVSTGHLGLAGMSERARLLGGELTVESALAGGTTVSLHLPLRAPVESGSVVVASSFTAASPAERAG